MKRYFLFVTILGLITMIIPHLGFVPSVRKWLVFFFAGIITVLSYKMYKKEKIKEIKELQLMHSDTILNENHGNIPTEQNI